MGFGKLKYNRTQHPFHCNWRKNKHRLQKFEAEIHAMLRNVKSLRDTIQAKYKFNYLTHCFIQYILRLKPYFSKFSEIVKLDAHIPKRVVQVNHIVHVWLKLSINNNIITCLMLLLPSFLMIFKVNKHICHAVKYNFKKSNSSLSVYPENTFFHSCE